MRRQIANAKVLVLALAAGFAASAGGQACAATTADSVSVAPEPASTTAKSLRRRTGATQIRSDAFIAQAQLQF